MSVFDLWSTETLHLTIDSSHSQRHEDSSAWPQYQERGGEVRSILEKVLKVQREAEERIRRIVDAQSYKEAKQLYLLHQVQY